MKKNQITVWATVLVLFATACSKEEQKTTDDAPVCQTIEFHIDWSDMSSDIINNFKITAVGKDFNGKSFSQALTGEHGELTFTKENVNIDNMDNHCPFTYSIEIESLVESGDENKKYNLQLKWQVYAVFKDAAGNALYTGSSQDATKDFIINTDYSRPQTVEGFESFKRRIERLLKEERTYVFFRGQSISSGEYFFSHTSVE